MGINGLTQFLRPIYVKKRVKDLKGSTFGVDAMAWLYRGFYGQKYANNDINERFLSFYFRMLQLLKKHNIKVGLLTSLNCLCVSMEGLILLSKDFCEPVSRLISHHIFSEMKD